MSEQAADHRVGRAVGRLGNWWAELCWRRRRVEAKLVSAQNRAEGGGGGEGRVM